MIETFIIRMDEQTTDPCLHRFNIKDQMSIQSLQLLRPGLIQVFPTCSSAALDPLAPDSTRFEDSVSADMGSLGAGIKGLS